MCERLFWDAIWEYFNFQSDTFSCYDLLSHNAKLKNLNVQQVTTDAMVIKGPVCKILAAYTVEDVDCRNLKQSLDPLPFVRRRM